jgi:hypothetical protein
VRVGAAASGWPSSGIRAVTDLFGSRRCEQRAFGIITNTRKFSCACDRQLCTFIERGAVACCDDRFGKMIV